MRSFEQRKAEIIRRSENRIKIRKKNRNRILTLCIPLCLAVIICSVTVLPNAFRVKTDTAAEENLKDQSSMSDVDVSETKHIYVAVEVEGKDSEKFYSKITDSAAVTNIYENIFYAFDIDDSDADIQITEPDKYDIVTDYSSIDDGFKDSAYESSESDSYTVTLLSAKGEKRVYKLDGNILTDVSRDVKIKLTANKLYELQLLLGIKK